MDGIIALLRSIDFWTIVGAIGSVAAVIVALIALPRFNRKSRKTLKDDSIKYAAENIERLVRDLMASYKIEGGRWESYAKMQSPGWKSTVPEFEKHLSGTMNLHQRVASELGVLFGYPEIKTSRFAKLAKAGETLGSELDKTMGFREASDAPLRRALEVFREARVQI